MARDAAFSFYYQDNLDLLEELGVEIVPFSPMRDSRLPGNLNGLYFGGGFPEVYAGELEDNRPIRKEISQTILSGTPAYAECGGLMYLGRSITDFEGRTFKTVGALPYRTAMTRKIKMAYLDVKTQSDNLLSRKGESFPGQMFHFSALKAESRLRYSYRLSDGFKSFRDGVASKNVLASYLHLHFWTQPSLAKNFIRAASAHEKN